MVLFVLLINTFNIIIYTLKAVYVYIGLSASKKAKLRKECDILSKLNLSKFVNI